MRFLLTICLFVSFISASAQFKTDLKRTPTFVFHLSSVDLKTVEDILRTSFGDAVGRWGMPKDNYSGFGASYITGITNHIDFMASVNGFRVYYPFKKAGYEFGKKLFLETDIAINIKLLSERSWLVPYLTVGIGAYRAANATGAYAPFGVGLQARVSPKFSLFGNFQYRAPVTAEAAHHLLYNFGAGIPLNIVFGKKRNNGNYNPPAYISSTPRQPLVIKDSDGDGVADEDDRCPTIKGVPTNGGCPVEDADGDGIPDVLDKCPNTPGFAKYEGCPLPDKDRDGIADDFDKCPDVPGFQKYQGCPGPDSDKDGVPDEIDKCPVQPGPASNNGCPISSTPATVVEPKAEVKPKEKETDKKLDEKPIKVEVKPEIKKDSVAPKPVASVSGQKPVKGEPLRNIFFDPNKNDLDDLTTYNLEQTLKSLRNNPQWQAQIKGYTDETEAKVSANKELALKRANIILQYFIGKNIDKARLTAIDGGIDKNATFNTPDNAGHRRAEIMITQ